MEAGPGGDMGEYGVASRFAGRLLPPAMTINADGSSPFVLVCDHASNRIPEDYGDLGLSLVDRLRHIAWDPGALAVSLALTELLDAPLVHSTVSRLVIDCNRFTDSDSLMPSLSEYTEIPGNKVISTADKGNRLAQYWVPFHEAIDDLLARRRDNGLPTILVCVHSFTPIFKEFARPWPIGILPALEPTYSRAVFDALQAADPEMNVGWNEPYAGAAGYSYTVEHHGQGLDAVMIEIRHDEILEPKGVARWASLLARCLESAREGRAAPPARVTTETGATSQ